VIFSGYENFVSKLDVGDRNDRPVWMGTVVRAALALRPPGFFPAIVAFINQGDRHAGRPEG